MYYTNTNSVMFPSPFNGKRIRFFVKSHWKEGMESHDRDQPNDPPKLESMEVWVWLRGELTEFNPCEELLNMIYDHIDC